MFMQFGRWYLEFNTPLSLGRAILGIKAVLGCAGLWRITAGLVLVSLTIGYRSLQKHDELVAGTEKVTD